MKFAFRAKKDVCKEKSSPPVGNQATDKRIRCRKSSKLQLTLHDCKNAKFELKPDHRSRCENRLMWNKTETVTEENRSEHVKLLAKYFLSGSLCPKSHIKFDIKHVVKMNRQIHCGNNDDITKCLYKQVKLFQKMIKMEASHQRKMSYHLPWRKFKSQPSNFPPNTKSVKHKNTSSTLEETSGQLKLNLPDHAITPATFGKLRHSCRSDRPHDGWVSANSNTNQSTTDKSDMEHRADKSFNQEDQTNMYVTYRYHNKKSLIPDKPSVLSFMNSANCDQITNRCKHITTGHIGVNLKCDGKLKSESKCLIGIPNSKRFGMINEDHCKVVSELVNDRLFNRQSHEVGIFIQENIMELWEQTNLKLDMAQLCLSSFFFPARNLINTSIHRDLHQFLSINIFKKEKEVRDIFGVKHNIHDRFEIDALFLVPAMYAAIFRHKDLSFLDSLAIVLGSCKENILVMKITT